MSAPPPPPPPPSDPNVRPNSGRYVPPTLPVTGNSGASSSNPSNSNPAGGPPRAGGAPGPGGPPGTGPSESSAAGQLAGGTTPGGGPNGIPPPPGGAPGAGAPNAGVDPTFGAQLAGAEGGMIPRYSDMNFLQNLNGVIEAQAMLRRNAYGIRLRICCELLLFLGCVHLGIFPDWWNGITDIGIAILLSTSLFRRASISTLVSVVFLSFLNTFVQMIALVSLLKIYLFPGKDEQEVEGHKFLFLTYCLLIAMDAATMLVTGNASAMLLRDVLQIIIRNTENAMEEPFLAAPPGPIQPGMGPISPGGAAPTTPASARRQQEALPQPFQGRAFRLEPDDV